MRNFQQKRTWKSIFYSKPVLIMLFMLLMFFAWVVFRFMGKMQLTAENKKIAEYRVNQLRKEKVALEEDIAKLNTEDGVEESIRNKFGWAKEGEGLIVIVDDKNPETSKDSESKGFFGKIKNWFRDN